MRRQDLARVTFVLAAVLLFAASALAQYPYQLPRTPLYSPPWYESLTVWKVGIEVGAAVLGFLVGAFFSPLLRPVRRSIFFGLIAAAVLYTWFFNTQASLTLSDVVAFFAFFVALGYGLQLGVKALRGDDSVPTSYGSAKWATEDYLREKGLFGGKGFLLGEFAGSGGPIPIHYAGARHLLTVAPTRSGKGVASIVPNLLTYEGSAFVIDPKGENAMISAVRRSAGDKAAGIPGLGQDVYLLDPWDIAAQKLRTEPACFNPIDWVAAGGPDAVENAFLLAEAMVPSGATGEAKFWDEESKALLMGLILYVATSKREAGQRHLGRVRDILLLDHESMKQLFREMYKEPNPIVASTAARTAGKEDKLLSNVLAGAQSHTHFLDSPRVRESLSRSDFRFEDLKTRPMTVYLILPADRLDTFGRWLRVLIQQALSVNARAVEVKPEKPVLFLLDEMAALGRLSMVEQAFGLMAGFGMQLWGIVQDLSQLERIYDKGWQTFISNSGVIQYFGSRDQITAEYFSALCGVTTIRIRSFSGAIARMVGSSSTSASGPNGGSSTTSESTTHTHTISSNEAQRQLAYPDELMVLKSDRQLIFVDNLDPMRATKLEWYSDPNLRHLGIDLQGEEAPRPKPKAASPMNRPPQRKPADVVPITASARQGTTAPPSAGTKNATPAKPAAVSATLGTKDGPRSGKPVTTIKVRPPPAGGAAGTNPSTRPSPGSGGKPQQRTIVKNFSGAEARVALYSDGTLEATMLATGEIYQFGSMDELKAFLATRQTQKGARA